MSAAGEEDLLALTASLVDIPSVSRGEKAIADFVEERLSKLPGLEVRRFGDNICARTSLRAAERLVIAGHLDTVG
ncbi:MAG: succinyl-diaminopimelate desuccinylase, partial [Acidimicrobiales bacterium]